MNKRLQKEHNSVYESFDNRIPYQKQYQVKPLMCYILQEGLRYYVLVHW